jgi:deoxyadenosine/deoxycytidine kinase
MYIIEGNIGAGKSTFLKLIKRYKPSMEVVFEPIDTWHTRQDGQSLLKHFYDNPYRWAYTMETLAMRCRVAEHLKEQKKTTISRLVERSIYSGHYCFAYNGYINSYFTDLEWQLYLEWFTSLTSEHCKPPHGFIYLKTDPEIAYQRVRQRNRVGEDTITPAYINQIHTRHEEFLVTKEIVTPDLKKVPVIIIECNEDFEQNLHTFLKQAQLVEDFIEAHK